jgi:hypothetical protein
MNTEENHFWDWFQETGSPLMYPSKLSKQEKDFLHNELKVHTRAYCGGAIVPQVITHEENNKAVIIFTSYGDERYFARIEKLVPANGGLKARFPNLPITAEQMLFTPDELTITDCQHNVDIYVEHIVPIDDELFEAVGTILFNVLGEKVMALNMGNIAITYVEEIDPSVREKLIPLPEIVPYVFGDIPVSMSVDESGNMVREGDDSLL